MEELFMLLIQLAVEGFDLFFQGLVLLVQMTCNLCDLFDLIDLTTRAVGDIFYFFIGTWPDISDNARAGRISFFYFILGLGMGAVSLHFCHDVFLRRNAARLIALWISPVVSGFISWVTARLEIFLRATIRPAYCFWWMLFFSFGICLVRFGFCHRPIF